MGADLDFNLETEEVVDDGQEGVVDPQDVDLPDEAEGAEGAEAGGGGQQKQSHEDNAAAKAARIRAEAETRARLEREYDAKVAGSGIINPYTGKPFANFKDFEAYAKQFREDQIKQKAEKENRPVAEVREEEDNRDYLRRKRAEEEARDQAEATKTQQIEKLRRDAAEFAGRYPDVDPVALEKNEKFRRFCGGRLYNEPLATLYGDYVELLGETESAAIAKAANKAQRGTGSGAGAGASLLTAEEQARLDEWNRENPRFKMTAKEFASR